jgi:hypothetical protein
MALPECAICLCDAPDTRGRSMANEIISVSGLSHGGESPGSSSSTTTATRNTGLVHNRRRCRWPVTLDYNVSLLLGPSNGFEIPKPGTGLVEPSRAEPSRAINATSQFNGAVA